ncbi:efflux RND transporter permease subunit [Planctomycetes bacterium SV_7m_r]
MIEFCVRNPVKVAVTMIGVVLFGCIALWQIPIQLTPEVKKPTISVSVVWPGASPYEVEHEIVQSLEEQLKDIKGMTKMTSWSHYSQGSVTMEFPVGTDITLAMLELNSRINQLREFPDDAFEPIISTANLSDRPVCWYVLSPRVPSDAELRDFVRRHPHLDAVCQPLLDAHKWDLRLYRINQLSGEFPEIGDLVEIADIRKTRRFIDEHVKSRFDRVRGVADTFLMGGQAEEMQVIVDPERLAARGLTIDDLRTALRSRNKDTSGGEIWDGKRRYVVRTLGQFSAPTQIERTIIATQDDVTTYVGDVAKVRLGYRRATDSYRRGGSELIGLGVLPETGSNVLEIVDELRAVSTELNEGLLAQRGMKLTEVWSDADYIDSSVGLVKQNIVIGGILTVLVLLAFLRSARSTIVIAIAVPTSIVGTFLILRLLGRSLNVVSLAGLAFAVGMIVDNSVVVLENIYRKFQRGATPREAAIQGTREVWGAVLASTLTTLAVFVPVLFTQEEAGQLFRDIALAISAAVGLSLIVSITLIPTASARLLASGQDSDRSASNTVVDRAAKGFVCWVANTNQWLLASMLRRLTIVTVFVSGALFVCWCLFPDVEYLPDGNKARVMCKLHPPPGYNVDKTEAISRKLFEKFLPYWEVDPSSPEAQQLDLPALSDLLVRAQPHEVMVQVQTEDPAKIRQWIPVLQSLSAEIPDMRGSAYQLSLFPGSSRKIDIELTGPDLDAVIRLAQQVQQRIETAIPDSRTSAVPGLWNANPELHVLPHWDRVAEVGINATELGYIVDALTDGAFVADYTTEGEKIDLRIIGDGSDASYLQDLGNRTVVTRDASLVTLSSLAEFKISSGPPSIRHIERRRAITVEVRPPDGVSLGRALEVVQRDVIDVMKAEGALPAGLQVSLGGTADRLSDSWQAMRFNLLLALVITYLLMAGLFESWVYPLVIILTVPLAAAGGVACLWLANWWTDQPLDIITMLGFVILIGTAVNNAILIVHHSIGHLSAGKLSSQEAVVESVRSRIRPIFMTTGTTVLGLFPLVVMPGAGSELYRGLGCVVLGGLVVSTMLTLFLVPSFFSLVMDARQAMSRKSLLADPPIPVGNHLSPREQEASVANLSVRESNLS